jgi:hypothetical protein
MSTACALSRVFHRRPHFRRMADRATCGKGRLVRRIQDQLAHHNSYCVTESRPDVFR